MFSFQLMVDGVYLLTGQSALLLVEEEPRPGPERALTLHLLTGDQIVREKAVRPRIALTLPVQVNSFWTLHITILASIQRHMSIFESNWHKILIISCFAISITFTTIYIHKSKTIKTARYSGACYDVLSCFLQPYRPLYREPKFRHWRPLFHILQPLEYSPTFSSSPMTKLHNNFPV